MAQHKQSIPPLPKWSHHPTLYGHPASLRGQNVVSACGKYVMYIITTQACGVIQATTNVVYKSYVHVTIFKRC